MLTSLFYLCLCKSEKLFFLAEIFFQSHSTSASNAYECMKYNRNNEPRLDRILNSFYLLLLPEL